LRDPAGAFIVNVVILIPKEADLKMAVPCALQMLSLREIIMSDPLDTLKKTAGTGWKNIELLHKRSFDSPGIWYGKSAEEVAGTAREYGLTIIGGYVEAADLAGPDIKKFLSFYKKIGAKRIVIPVDYFGSREILSEKCSFYNKTGEMCREQGLSLVLETQYHEWQTIDGERIIDLMAAGTKPELFSFSLNIYWLMRGLTEPLPELKKFTSRISSLVLQDYPLDEIDKFNMWRFDRYHTIGNSIQKNILLKGGEIKNIAPLQCRMFTEFGKGFINFQPLIDTANEIGTIKYIILKQDYTRMRSEYDSIALSLKNARKMKGLILDT
jgi:sugar phosphate isomerase/epimerase